MPDNKAIVMKLLDALWNQGRLSVIDEFVSLDFVGFWPFRTEPVRGPLDYKDLVVEVRKAFPDQTVEVLDIVSEGDRVVTRFEVTGTHRAEFLTAPPTYRRLSLAGLSMSRITDGRVVETFVQMDTLKLLRGLGIVSSNIVMPDSCRGGRTVRQSRRLVLSQI